MIWEILVRVENMNAQFLEGLENTLILAGEELADHQQSKVRHLDSENQSLIF